MTIRVGIIGCGSIAAAHIKGYQQNDARIIAVTDVNRDAAAAVAEANPGAEIFDGVGDLVASGKVDVVSICTPPVAHEDAAITALQHNVHVLLEKPLAHSVASARAIYDASRQSQALLMTAYRHRFLPANLRMKEMITDGKLGRLVFFNNVFCGPAFAMKDKWFTKKAVAGGGSILDTSSHSVDLFRFMIGEIVEQSQVSHTHLPGIDVEDAGILTVKSESGAIGAMISSFVAADGQAFIDIMGQEGHLVFNYGLNELKYKKRGATDWEVISVPASNGFAEQIRHFLRAVKGEEQLLVTGYDGLRAVEVIQAAYNNG